LWLRFEMLSGPPNGDRFDEENQMKTLLQYLFALALILIGIALLCNPSRPAETTSRIQPQQGSDSQPMDRPAFRPTMRLA
jgi:hypothetical protein